MSDTYVMPSCGRRTTGDYMSDLISMSGPIRVVNRKLAKGPGLRSPKDRNTRDLCSRLLVAGQIADFWLSPEGWMVRLDEGGEWEPFDGSTTAAVETHTHRSPQGRTSRRTKTMTTKTTTKTRPKVAMKALPEAVEAFIANLIYPPKAEFARALASHRFLAGPAPKETGAAYEAKVAARLDRIAAAKVAA